MSPFQILYGMHRRGVCELCDLGQLEKRSANGEEFATRISELQEQVKARLQQSNTSYKARADSKRRENNYEVGYLVLAYLKRYGFPKEDSTWMSAAELEAKGFTVADLMNKDS